MKLIYLAAFLFITKNLCGCILNPAIKTENSHGPAIVSEAQQWLGRSYQFGDASQCANFVREVLAKVCHPNFDKDAANVIQSKHPWDAQAVIKKEGSNFGPGYADSLAGSDLGKRITFEALQPGDLVFLERSFGQYGPGVITHVGIYTGNGEYIDRSSADVPIKKSAFNKSLFYGALRLSPSLCQKGLK